jgi:hypothetical protein
MGKFRIATVPDGSKNAQAERATSRGRNAPVVDDWESMPPHRLAVDEVGETGRMCEGDGAGRQTDGDGRNELCKVVGMGVHAILIV